MLHENKNKLSTKSKKDMQEYISTRYRMLLVNYSADTLIFSLSVPQTPSANRLNVTIAFYF